jgi:membrane-associated phospholipid phosphatase
MRPADHLIHLTMSVFLIFGVYQFYFWCQRQKWVPVRKFSTKLDDLFPFWPVWGWIYSFLYYPALIYLNWVVESPRHFNHLVMSFIILLGMQMVFFLFFPVETPIAWRALNKGRNWSEKFLQYVQKFDQPSNCFPSMHVSVATLTALHARASLGPAAFAFPVLIAISCIFTKQHYLVDLPFGALLGWLAWLSFVWMG